MREHHIFMRDWEVRPVIEGWKTQTRRIIKPQPTPCIGGGINWYDKGRSFTGSPQNFRRFCPYGQPGDRLWVRETFASFPSTGGLRFYRTGVIYHRPNDPRLLPEHPYREVVYRADGEDVTKEHPNGATSKWRSPVAMPRWASRITLEITSVRVERLQDISDEDARAEGIIHGLHYDKAGIARTPREGFARVWDIFHGKPKIKRDDDGNVVAVHDWSWRANPWVWVIEFKRVENSND